MPSSIANRTRLKSAKVYTETILTWNTPYHEKFTYGMSDEPVKDVSDIIHLPIPEEKTDTAVNMEFIYDVRVCPKCMGEEIRQR